jgi:four helix bundle protein
MANEIRSHRDLVVWQKAVDFVVECYDATRSFPPDERFGLCSQMQRAAVSIPANIAEGRGRRSNGAFVNHLRIAAGSIAELDTHLEVAQRLGYLTTDSTAVLLQQLDEIGRMTTGLRRSLEKSPPPDTLPANPSLLPPPT